MRTKLVILLFSILVATTLVIPSQAQIPGAGWWIYDGDSLYVKIPDVWVTGDSLHFAYAVFDSLSGVNLDSLGRIQIDTLTVNDSLNVGGSSLFEGFVRTNKDLTVDSSLVVGDSSSFSDDVLIEKNLTVRDTTFCDYYKGLSPMHFLSPSYFSYIETDTLKALVTIAPSFSGTDFVNTQGYWDIIAGPDSLEWTETSNFVAGAANMGQLRSHGDTLYSASRVTTNLYISKRNPSTGAWSSVASKVVGSGKCVDFVFGGGDSLHVTWDAGTTTCYACWDGSAWVNENVFLPTGYRSDRAVAIARHADGTIYTLGMSGSYWLQCYTYSGGSWAAPDTVGFANMYTYHPYLYVDGSGTAHVLGNLGSGIFKWSRATDNGTTLWDLETVVGSDAHGGGVTIDGNDDVWTFTLNSSTLKGYLFRDQGVGWIPMDTVTVVVRSVPHEVRMACGSDNKPYIVYSTDASVIKVLYWDGSNLLPDDPLTAINHNSPAITFAGTLLAVMASDGSNEDLFLKAPDPGMNTGHRNGALLIRTNVQNDAADIYIKTDSTVHIECDSLIIEGPTSITDYALATAAQMTGLGSGIANTFFWSGTITHDSVTAAGLNEDIKLITAFPAKYKIIEIFVDITEVWDDAAGPISAVTLSAGWTGANYDDLIQTQDIFTAITQLGDVAGELNYSAVQGGIRPSWSATTDLYLRFVATGANLSTLSTGELIIYIVYQVF